jgi:hypothetical protein
VKVLTTELKIFWRLEIWPFGPDPFGQSQLMIKEGIMKNERPIFIYIIIYLDRFKKEN